MSTLSVSIVQADLHWHQAAENRAMFTELLNGIEQPGDLVVLPEMFTTGFTMDAQSQAEPMDGPSMSWLQEMAARHETAICGSLIIEDSGEFFNRFVLMQADGQYHLYDKRHLFRLADEHSHYSPGTDRVVLDFHGFRVCPMVCYDLRFPVWSRNRSDYDLLLYVANWPSPRHFAWQTLIRARAIENQCYVGAVNRAGTDGNELPYLGGSAVIDFLGATLADLGDAPGTATVTLDRDSLDKFRARFPFDKDADEFTLSV